jgi:Domain of unknown function (DUF397)
MRPGRRWRRSSLAHGKSGHVRASGLPAGRVRLRRGNRGPVLEFTAAEWDAFVEGVRRGEFDRAAG